MLKKKKTLEEPLIKKVIVHSIWGRILCQIHLFQLKITAGEKSKCHRMQ